MSNTDDIRDAIAEPFLEVASGDYGFPLLYSHRSADPVTVYALFCNTGKTVLKRGQRLKIQTDETNVSFEVPYQLDSAGAQFPPADGVETDDILVDEDGNEWNVDSVENDDCVGAVWKLNCILTDSRFNQAGA